VTSKFPSTETFLITWLGGTCGAFIYMLIYNILFSNAKLEISPSKNGHAHTNQRLVINKLCHTNNSNDWKHIYKVVVPKFPKLPFILVDHEETDLEAYFDRFPIGKIIVIRFDERMVPLLQGNLFFKNTLEMTDYSSGKDNEHWDRLKKENDYLSEYDLPHDIPSETIEYMLKKFSKNYNIQHYFSEQYIPPKEYSDRFCFINFYDIIFNKSKVLKQLSEITNRPITEFVDNQYDIYLEKQYELINTKLSWIDLS
jgi:hypothetical protein